MAARKAREKPLAQPAWDAALALVAAAPALDRAIPCSPSVGLPVGDAPTESGLPWLPHFGRLTMAGHPSAITKMITTTKPRTTRPTEHLPTSAAISCPIYTDAFPKGQRRIPL